MKNVSETPNSEWAPPGGCFVQIAGSMVSSHVWWWESQAWGTCSGLLGGSWGSCLLSHRWQGSAPCFFFSPPYSSSPSLSTFSNSVQRKYQTDPYILIGWVHQTQLTLLLQMSAVISQARIWQRWVETAFRKVFWRTLCSVQGSEVRWRKCLLVVWLWGIAIIAPSAGKSTITITIWCMTIIAS